MWSQKETTTTRDVVASEIPAGTRFTIPAGTHLQITQSLGGSYTVMVPMGYLARIDGKDADAIGEEPEQRPSEEALSAKSVEELCWDQLRTCYDPEIPVNCAKTSSRNSSRCSESGRRTSRSSSIRRGA